MSAPTPEPESSERDGEATDVPVASRPPMSQLAIVSIMCSAIFCCPLTSLAGFVTGAIAVRRIERAGGALRGRGLALGSMFLGTLGFVAWMLFASQLSERLRTDLELELRETVTALFDPDATVRHETLRAQFEGAGRRAGATAAALDAFVGEANARYGAFESVEIIGRPRAASASGSRPESLAGLRFSFEDRSLIGEVRYALAPSFGGESLMPGVLLLELRIDDDRLGELAFPAGANAVDDARGEATEGDGADAGDGDS